MSIDDDELDADIIHEALWGEPPSAGHAFCRLYEHYELRVRNAVARAAHHTGYHHRIEELRQDVWVRLLERDRKLLRYYKPESGPLGSFLGRLAYQQAITTVRRDRRQMASDPFVSPIVLSRTDDIPDDDALCFVANLVQSDIYRKLMALAMEELEDLDLLVIREIYVGRRLFRDVAAEHDLKPERLYKRNERLKKKLVAWSDQLLGYADESGVFPAEASAASSALLVALILGGLAFPLRGELGPAHPHPSLSPVEGASCPSGTIP